MGIAAIVLAGIALLWACCLLREQRRIKISIKILKECVDRGANPNEVLEQMGYDITAKGLIRVKFPGKQAPKL